MSAGQRCVAAQTDFNRRREPAQFIISCTALVRHIKCGFSEIIFLANRLKDRIIEPIGKWHNRSLITGEGTICKCIDVKIRQVSHWAPHDAQSFPAGYSPSRLYGLRGPGE